MDKTEVSATESDEYYMRKALALAERAEALGEVPVGALVVCNSEIVGEGWNQVISGNDPSAHAEVVAIRAASRKQGNYRLPDCELYVTIETCTMCLGAIIHARIQRVVYGAPEVRAGVLDSNPLVDSNIYNHKFLWRGGVLEEECGRIISRFFQRKR